MVLGVSSRIVFTCALAAGLPAWGQFSSAYRALGQPDLRRNGVNMVQGLEMNGPAGVASDFRHGEVHLYISDARNHRVLAWRDARAFQTGDPPALILGQPSAQSSAPRGIGARGFNTPLGLAVDPANGNRAKIAENVTGSQPSDGCSTLPLAENIAAPVKPSCTSRKLMTRLSTCPSSLPEKSTRSISMRFVVKPSSNDSTSRSGAELRG